MSIEFQNKLVLLLVLQVAIIVILLSLARSFKFLTDGLNNSQQVFASIYNIEVDPFKGAAVMNEIDDHMRFHSGTQPEYGPIGISESTMQYIVSNYTNLVFFKVSVLVDNELDNDIDAIELVSGNNNAILVGKFLVGDHPWVPKHSVNTSEGDHYLIVNRALCGDGRTTGFVNSLPLYLEGEISRQVHIRTKIWFSRASQ